MLLPIDVIVPAAKKRAAMERAAAIKAERRAREAEDMAGMDELEQLHRLNLRK